MARSDSEQKSRAPGLAHVGITVDDLDEALEWYCSVLDLELISGPIEVSSSDKAIGDQVLDVFGREVTFRQAHLALGNDTALELFEFTDPAVERPADGFPFWQTGVSHICLYHRDIDQIVSRIAASKGRVRNSKIWEVIPGEAYRMCFCEDPFGNVVEIYSHSHAEVFGVRAGYQRREAKQ